VNHTYVQIDLETDTDNLKYESQYQLQLGPLRTPDIQNSIGNGNRFRGFFDVFVSDSYAQRISLRAVDQSLFEADVIRFAAAADKV
jgi:hypothetical protein